MFADIFSQSVACLLDSFYCHLPILVKHVSKIWLITILLSFWLVNTRYTEQWFLYYIFQRAKVFDFDEIRLINFCF